MRRTRRKKKLAFFFYSSKEPIAESLLPCWFFFGILNVFIQFFTFLNDFITVCQGYGLHKIVFLNLK